MLGLGIFALLVVIAAMIWGGVNRKLPDPGKRRMMIWAKLLPEAPIKAMTRGTCLVLTQGPDNTWIVDSEVGQIATIDGGDAGKIAFRADRIGKPSAYPEGKVNRDTILIIVEFDAAAA